MKQKILSLCVAGIFISGCDQAKVPTKDEIKEKAEEGYQNSRSSFDSAKYPIPKSNPAAVGAVGGCHNGIGGVVPAIGKGVFSETLFGVDADMLDTDVLGTVLFAPYSKVYNVADDVIWEKDVDTFDRALKTQRQVERGFYKHYTFQNGVASLSSYDNMETDNGFPTGYLNRQVGLTTMVSTYSDACNKGINPKVTTYTKVDLSGKPISSIIDSDSVERMYYGYNGLYTQSEVQYKYVNPNFAKFIQANQNLYEQLKQAGNFPDNSYVYIPTKVEREHDVGFVNMANANVLKIDLKAAEKAIVENSLHQSNMVTFVKQGYQEGITVYYPYGVDDGKPILDIPVIVNQDGHLFYGEQMNKGVLDYSRSSSGSDSLMNSVAHSTLLDRVKKIYQAKARPTLEEVQKKLRQGKANQANFFIDDAEAAQKQKIAPQLPDGDGT